MISIIDFTLHIDKYLGDIIQSFSIGVYGLVFLIIFLETGLVITPFLPGDSLIFAAGAFAAKGVLNVILLFVILSLAAIIGDTVNYWIGNIFGERVFERSKLFKKEYLDKTKNFYEKYGNKAIVIGRFIPIIRTFVPFIAGIGKMRYSQFLLYNVLGGILWVGLFLFGGYFLGEVPLVRDNFSIFIILIIIVSVLPVLVKIISSLLKQR